MNRVQKLLKNMKKYTELVGPRVSFFVCSEIYLTKKTNKVKRSPT
jgi:hypothetical protein